MNIAIRVDSSIKIGTGHVMRCLTLAKQLTKKHHSVEFICRKAIGSVEGLIEEKGFIVNLLPEITKDLWEWTSDNWKEDFFQSSIYLDLRNIDLIIVDHYSIDYKWERAIRGIIPKLMVIDDLANRKHECDILLDHNFYKDMNTRYQNLVGEKTRLLLGPNFALLREEFFMKYSQTNHKQILISFGGSDPTNETLKILNIVKILPENYRFKIILGTSNPNKQEIVEIVEKHSNFRLLINIDNMAEEINNSLFVIGAGGISALERVILNKPSLVISVADNQVEIIKNFAEKGVIKYIGDSSENYDENLLYSIQILASDNHTLKEMIGNMKNIKINNDIQNIVRIIEELK